MATLDRRTVLKSAAAWALAPQFARTWADDPKTPAPKADPYADGVLIDGEPPKPAPGSFTIAVLPDTQHYSERFPDTYLAQTRWIIERQQERNIAAVLHLGDITNRSTPAEWKNARQAMRQLDGRLPYFFTTGNHDYSDGGVCKDRTTRLNEYFPLAHYRGRPN